MSVGTFSGSEVPGVLFLAKMSRKCCGNLTVCAGAHYYCEIEIAIYSLSVVI